jgi:hypothetical protein
MEDLTERLNDLAIGGLGKKISKIQIKMKYGLLHLRRAGLPLRVLRCL